MVKRHRIVYIHVMSFDYFWSLVINIKKICMQLTVLAECQTHVRPTLRFQSHASE